MTICWAAPYQSLAAANLADPVEWDPQHETALVHQFEHLWSTIGDRDSQPRDVVNILAEQFDLAGGGGAAMELVEPSANSSVSEQ
jgi:hypothetical protein